MHELANGLMLVAVGCIVAACLLMGGCTDIRNVMDYGVCSVRHQGCGQ